MSDTEAETEVVVLPPTAGIPTAEFIDNVDVFLEKSRQTHEEALKTLQDLYSKFKLVEMRLDKSKNNLKGKMPEIKKTLEALRFLKTKQDQEGEYETNFELASNVLAKAKLKKVDSCCLWLGANVMMEFTFEEAENLLSGNLETATVNLAKVKEQLAFLRDQITTTEVNMARVYNHEVRMRRAGKLPAIEES
ncbi:von Hippel-Lindau binding protein-like protein 1 [Baffinella frigidus]|nr:von Hippel-Lindau binding protein-like protein 1 [Cryptophyta sp. CCMP2293]